MTLESATEFVFRMKNDKEFRCRLSCMPNKKDLDTSLKEQGFSFQMDDLIKAMSGCMESMESCSEIKTNTP